MDTKQKKRKWAETSGLLSLEASIALTMFIFLMLFMYSFFVVFEARNEMAHVLLTTADSLSLDAFANEAPKDNSIQQIVYGLYGEFTDSNGTYTETSKWYEQSKTDNSAPGSSGGGMGGRSSGNFTSGGGGGGGGGSAGGRGESSLHQVIENRFIAYLAGGDRKKADEILKSLNIVNGIDGLDFSKSRVENGKLFLEVQYELEYEFKMFGLGRMQFSQSCCSKLWK